jgi:hypothetical protein
MYEQIFYGIQIVSILMFSGMLINLGRLTRKLNRQIRTVRPAAPTPADKAISTSRAALDKARAETSELRVLVDRLGAMADDLHRFNDQNNINHKGELR